MAISPQQSLLLRPARWKLLVMLAVSLAFTTIGALMIRDNQGIKAWLSASFFGLCSTVFAIQLFPRASYLHLRPDGFVACTLFRRWPLVRWDSVSEFQVVAVPPLGKKMVVYNDATATLPDTFGLKPDQLAELLNEWRGYFFRRTAGAAK